MRKKPEIPMKRKGYYPFGGLPLKRGGKRTKTKATMPIAAQVSRNTLMLRQLRNTEEKKYLDTVVNLTVPIAGNAAQVVLLNGMSQGNTASTRIGNKVTMKGLQLRLNAKAGNGEADGQLIRFILVAEKKPEGSASAWTSICNSVDTLSNYSMTLNNNMIVLWDETFAMDTSQFQLPIKKWIDLKGLVADYSRGNAGTVADFQQNSIYLMVNTLNNTVATDLDGNVRLRYTDA